MEVTTFTNGFTVPPNTTIVSITANTATLSNNITGSGQITLTAFGPSDTTAVDGGMIVKGTTDKSILWKGEDAGVTYNTWVSSENFDLASGKIFTLNSIKIADPNTLAIGPNDGTAIGEIDVGGSAGYTLGSAVTGAGATTFSFSSTGQVKLPNGDTSQRTGNPVVGMMIMVKLISLKVTLVLLLHVVLVQTLLVLLKTLFLMLITQEILDHKLRDGQTSTLLTFNYLTRVLLMT